MSLQTRIWHHFQETFLRNAKISKAFLRLRNAKKSTFPLLRDFFHETLPFCFKNPNNFHSGRKVQKMTKFYIPQSQKSLRDLFESKSGNSVNNFQGAWGDFVLFCATSDFCAKRLEFPPKIGKWGKWIPKDQGNHYVYKGWRHGGGNVIFCSKSEKF